MNASRLRSDLGSVQRKGGRWYVVMSVKGLDGKRRRDWIPCGRDVKTERQARAVLRREQNKKDTGAYITPSKLKTADYFEQWVEGMKSQVRVRTAENYRANIKKHIIPVIGHIALKDLSAQHIKDLKTKALEGGRVDKKGGLSPRSVALILGIVHHALKDAVREGILGRNVAEAVEPPQVKRKEFKTLEPAQVNKLLEATKDSPYHPVFFMAIWTGMRRSELLGLRWGDVNASPAQTVVTVAQTLHELKSGELIFESPKTDRSRRQIVLPPKAAEFLKEHREAQEAARAKVELPPLDDTVLVFSWPDGRPMRPSNVGAAWRDATKDAGLKGIRFHDCRHGFATGMLKAGVHPLVVSRMLGHSSIGITLDIYSHPDLDLQAAAGKNFEAGLTVSPEAAEAQDREAVEVG